MIYYHKLQVKVVCVQWMNVCVCVILTKYYSGSYWIFFFFLENCKFNICKSIDFCFAYSKEAKCRYHQWIGQYSPIMPEGYNICR